MWIKYTSGEGAGSFWPRGMANPDGSLTDDVPFITLDKHLAPERQGMVLAHELGHWRVWDKADPPPLPGILTSRLQGAEIAAWAVALARLGDTPEAREEAYDCLRTYDVERRDAQRALDTCLIRLGRPKIHSNQNHVIYNIVKTWLERIFRI